MNWWKCQHGAPVDAKLGFAASKAGCVKAYATALWWCILDAASQSETRGNVTETHVTVSCFDLGIDAETGARLMRAFCDIKLLSPNGDVSAWEKHQGKSMVSSTERVRKHRETMKRVSCNAETDETPLEKSREEKNRKNTPKAPKGAFAVEFDQWWAEYPHKVGKPVALKSYLKARADGVLPETLMAGLGAYKASKPPDRPWCNPSTWLNQQRWNDQPAPSTGEMLNGRHAVSMIPLQTPNLDERYRRELARWLAAGADPRKWVMDVFGPVPDQTRA